MELRDEIAGLIEEEAVYSLHEQIENAHELAGLILSIPTIKEALAFHESCKSALEHGDFYVTKENFTGVGGVSAS